MMLITAAFLLPLLGCRNTHIGASALPLTGTQWSLMELNGSSPAESEGLRTPTLLLGAEEKRASGTSGINRYSGSFDVDGARLKFGMFMGTRMVGPPAAMGVEDAFLKALGQVDSWKITAEQLELSSGETVLLRFSVVQ